MQVVNLKPSKRLALFFHSIFAFIYLLLIVRAGLSLYEGPIDFSNLPDNSLPTLLVKRICGILYAPFFGLLMFSPESNADLIVTILFAVLCYALIHYGMFMQVPIERRDLMVNKILAFCRAIFFLAGTLLLLLIVARMGVMLYQDITYGRMMIGVPAKK